MELASQVLSDYAYRVHREEINLAYIYAKRRETYFCIHLFSASGCKLLMFCYIMTTIKHNASHYNALFAILIRYSKLLIILYCLLFIIIICIYNKLLLAVCIVCYLS